jgi:hypothetical protein
MCVAIPGSAGGITPTAAELSMACLILSQIKSNMSSFQQLQEIRFPVMKAETETIP